MQTCTLGDGSWNYFPMRSCLCTCATFGLGTGTLTTFFLLNWIWVVLEILCRYKNLNNLHFMMKVEKYNLTFLDIWITKEPSVQISMELFRKPTSGNSILQAESFYHPFLVCGIPIGLYQVSRNCSNDSFNNFGIGLWMIPLFGSPFLLLLSSHLEEPDLQYTLLVHFHYHKHWLLYCQLMGIYKHSSYTMSKYIYASNVIQLSNG